MEYKEFKGKSVDEAVSEACIQFGASSDKLDIKVIDKGSTGFLGLGSKPAVIQVAIKQVSLEEIVRKFLGDVFQAMKIEVEMKISVNEENRYVDIELSGTEMGILIGKRGQTLDSLQYLVSLVVNKECDNYFRVKMDTENYRQRRRETLENLAKNLAFKVKRTRRSVSLEPMNPYERRVIHSTLQNDRNVTTKSEGEEPFRHVVISFKSR